MFRFVLDEHSKIIQSAQLQRPRKYDDEIQHYDRPHPPNAPRWSYIEQAENMLYDTEVENIPEEDNMLTSSREELIENVIDMEEDIEDVLDIVDY